MTGTKISEFNFKLLNNLISCGKSLHKWKRADLPLCIYCGGQHTVEHMLFSCKIPTMLRNNFETWIGTIISWRDIILLNDHISKRHSELLSITMYIIFKKWLIDKGRRRYEDILVFCRRDLLRQQLFYEDKNKQLANTLKDFALSLNEIN
jgi:hypothetical protein